MLRTGWRLSELAGRLQVTEDFEYLGHGDWTPSTQAQPQALQQAFAGSILMRKRWQARPNLSGLAIVAPTSEEARADGLYLMRDDHDPINLSILAHDSAAAQDKPPVKLVKWATILRDFVLLVPNALTHGDPANRVPLPALAVNFREGDAQATRTVGVANFDIATRTVTYFVVEASGRPTTKTAHVLYLMRGIDPRLTGFRDFDNERYRLVKPSEAPGGFQCTTDATLLPPLYPITVRATTGAAPGSSTQAHAIPPPPPIPRAHLAAREADTQYAQNVRMLLAGATDVKLEGESMSITLTALSEAVGKIATRLAATTQEAAATTAAQIDAYVDRIESTIPLMWTERVLQLAKRAAPTMHARGELMYEHSIVDRTPKKQGQEGAATGATGASDGMGMGAGVGEQRQGGGGARGKRARGGERAAREAIDLSDGSGDSDADSEDDTPLRGAQAKKNKQGERDAFTTLPEETLKVSYPAVAALLPSDGTTMAEFGGILVASASARAQSATDAISEALALAGIPERMLFRYGSDEEVALAVADAMLSVACTAITAGGGAMPTAPQRKEGIGAVINTILAGLHAAAQQHAAARTHGVAGGGGGSGSNTHEHQRLLSAMHANNRPANEHEREFSRAAPIGTGVAQRISNGFGDNATAKSWAAAAATADVGKIIAGTPTDILRLQMADTHSRDTTGALMDGELRDALNAAARAREHRATRAIESNLGAELDKDMQKKLLSAVMMLKFSKIPALNLVCAASKSEDPFGHSNVTSQCHAVQGITAVRAGVVAAWPEISFEALRDSEDVVRTLLLGKSVIKIEPEVSERAAAAMFKMVGKHIEDHAEAFRQGQTCLPDANGKASVWDMIDNNALREKVEKKRDELKNTTELMSQTASSSTPPMPRGLDASRANLSSSGKKKLTTLFTEWRQRFGHDPCIFFWNKKGVCAKGEQCDKKHAEAALLQTDVDAWATQNCADCAVGEKSNALSNAELQTLGLALATTLFPSGTPHTAAERPSRVQQQIAQGGAAVNAGEVESNASTPLRPGAARRLQQAQRGEQEPSLEYQPTPAFACRACQDQHAQGRRCGTCGRLVCPVCAGEKGAVLRGMLPSGKACACEDLRAAARQRQAYMQLRKEPEAPALERAELSMHEEVNAFDPMRNMDEVDEIKRRLPMISGDDNATVAPAKPHRVDREEERIKGAGHDPGWRPTGDATTLFKEGKEHVLRDYIGWFEGHALDEAKRDQGEWVDRRQDFRCDVDEVMRPEAAVQGSWIISEHLLFQGVNCWQRPVPMRVFFGREPRRREAAVDPEYYRARWEAGDLDADICAQIAQYGLDRHTTQRHVLLADNIYSKDDDLDMKAIVDANQQREVDQGAYVDYKGVACFPGRQPPRFAVDEGMKLNGKGESVRKIRSVVNYSHPKPIEGAHRYPEGNSNSAADLSDPACDIQLTSGQKFWRSGGICMSSKAPCAVAKRDGDNAFRRTDEAPLDCWEKLQVRYDKNKWLNDQQIVVYTRIDFATTMGETVAMSNFQRAMEVPNRDVNQRLAAFDRLHPPTQLSLIEWREDRIEHGLGDRIDYDGQYCDDSIRGGADDGLNLKVDLAGHGEQYVIGNYITRMRAKMVIFDAVFENDLKLVMAEGNKRAFTRYDWMVVLGVEGNLYVPRLPGDHESNAIGAQRFPEAKVPKAQLRISDTLENAAYGEMVDQTEIEQVVGIELWAARVSVEIHDHLGSGYALINAKPRVRGAKGGGKVTLSNAFIGDQHKIWSILERPWQQRSLPLVPASHFPPFGHPRHSIIAQDASTSTGAGGWILTEGVLHVLRAIWPMRITQAFREGRCSISPAELWIEAVMVRLHQQSVRWWPSDRAAEMIKLYGATTLGQAGGSRIGNEVGYRRRLLEGADAREHRHRHGDWSRYFWITDFTDNESARAGANRGSSRVGSMNGLAKFITSHTRVTPLTSMRTERISTKENATADAISREGGLKEAWELARRMRIPYQEHSLAADDEIWEMLCTEADPPRSPPPTPPGAQ